MGQITQRTIEYFFDKHGVKNPDIKARILPQVTDIIYDYNMLVVNLEKETDEYKKNQIMNDIKEDEDKIQETFEDESKK